MTQTMKVSDLKDLRDAVQSVHENSVKMGLLELRTAKDLFLLSGTVVFLAIMAYYDLPEVASMRPKSATRATLIR